MNKDIFFVLSKLVGSKKIVSIHYVTEDRHEEAYISVGFVDSLNAKELRVLIVSTDGENSGYDVIRIERIFRIDVNGRYESKIAFLQENCGKITSLVKLSAKKTKNILLNTLKEAKDKKLIVAIWLIDDDGDAVYGFVEEIGKKIITLKVINEYGDNDGSCYISLSKIDSVDCETQRLRVLKFLNKYWNAQR